MWLALIILCAAVGYAVVTYNSLIALRNRARDAWSDIDVQLKRRHDLIPNLVAVVQGYATHEKTVFEDVARLRAKAMELQSGVQRADAEDQLSTVIKSLFAVAESYPELKADKNFRQLQSELAEVEDHIQYARRYYNAVVRDLNTKCETFPSGLIASLFGIGKLPYFQADEESRQPVRVDLSEDKSDENPNA
ncbi:MAG: LemA family protein [Armatimonadota bacterium]|nr:LemA family protein [Armatimonadota bacterium]